MARESNLRILLVNAAYVSAALLTIGFLALWTTDAFADLAAFGECTDDKVLELLQFITIIIIVSLFFEHLLGELLFGTTLPTFKIVVRAIGKKFVPWLGATVITIELVHLLSGCIPLL
jgi:hypothetical protein